MRDVDCNDKSNSSARRSNDSSWLNFPVILEGPYISGKAEDGSDIPLPGKFSSYQPWIFVLSKDETKKVVWGLRINVLNLVKSLCDKTSGKGKNIPKRPTSKSSSKTTSSMDYLSRKRKRYDSSSSSESSEDDILSPEDLSVPSSLKELSNLFVGDLLTAVDNEEFNRSFEMVSKICDAPTLDDPSLRGAASAINPNLQFTIGSLGARLSYLISSDYQRRLIKLEKENDELKTENSTNCGLIRRARERNDELIDLYNFSDEAANLPDDETLLEQLNSSLNNYPNQGFENLSSEELRLKYAALRKSHRSLLTSFNNFKHRLPESQEKIQVLETKKNKLINEKDEIALKGGKALEKFQESIIEVQKERDLALSEKNILFEERNLIRSELLIESEAEFSWAARVLNDARKDLAINVNKEKNYLQKIEELETRLASEEKDLSARNSKYRQLKKNFTITVSNNSNNANRAREVVVKKVCVENNIPLTKYKFPEIPDNEHISDISDSEGEDEESEEEISGSEAERNE
ncbi:intracellular protein transport protein USO1-like [Papaver somniferum]|uniref:intracellular protein transport protein USO1-like n=1 Tax=Papaver somniferum TaxID=3469 RepID=UPI000E6F5613|nr:intracellular protein transport protein USO1-like [Papaver somniferum]